MDCKEDHSVSEATENQTEQKNVNEQVESENSANEEVEVTETENNAEQTEDSTQAEELSVEEYKSKVAELEAKVEESENRYLRLRADFENMRRRNQLDLQAAEKYRAQNLLTELLPVIDNFERALQVEVTSEDAKALYKGIEMVYNSLMDATKKEGLELIPALGEPFDPTVHQAVMQESDSEKESGIVLKELQKGYKLKDRVIRPSMVSVNE